MVTLVGTQKQFVDAIKELLELEFDAIEAYKAAIERFDSKEYKSVVSGFLSDHEGHAKGLRDAIKAHKHTPPEGAGVGKNLLTKGKVVIATIMGDRAILMAMHSNEEDTNVAYGRMVERSDAWEEVKLMLKKAQDDEHRHKAWFKKELDK